MSFKTQFYLASGYSPVAPPPQPVDLPQGPRVILRLTASAELVEGGWL